MSKNKTYSLVRTAIMAALYVVLALVSIRAGNLRITFASLPVVVSAVLFGPGAAAAVALMGEFLNQLLSYGLSATTPLWLLPPVVRGVCIGLATRRSRRAGLAPENRPAVYFAVNIGVALFTTACNTVVIWLDSVIYGYYSFAYVFGSTLLRLASGVVTAAVVSTISLPVLHFLRRQRLGGI